jgi:hypothetical protein
VTRESDAARRVRNMMSSLVKVKRYRCGTDDPDLAPMVQVVFADGGFDVGLPPERDKVGPTILAVAALPAHAGRAVSEVAFLGDVWYKEVDVTDAADRAFAERAEPGSVKAAMDAGDMSVGSALSIVLVTADGTVHGATLPYGVDDQGHPRFGRYQDEVEPFGFIANHLRAAMAVLTSGADV